MAKFVKVLNSVISLQNIKKVTIEYNNGTIYSNKWIHSMLVEYHDGTRYEFNTTDKERAEQDYDGLKNALLGVKYDNLLFADMEEIIDA